ncbi:sodium/nucleoside cotransporter 1 [Anopheles darlingi]|uniref:Sodium/nucleoside cotransporter n=1 Tax=Anopheles darlingi TaxID=43151 RepID=W5J7S2_ANODA|nr:sodium/nucleoside cotransporter 1 [Anopheles darlingi]
MHTMEQSGDFSSNPAMEAAFNLEDAVKATPLKLDNPRLAWWQHKQPSIIKRIMIFAGLNGAVAVFLGFAVKHYLKSTSQENDCKPNCGIRWCDGFGMLLLLLAFIYAGLLYFLVIKPGISEKLKARLRLGGAFLSHFFFQWPVIVLVTIMLLTLFGIFLFFDSRHDTYRLMSLAGVLALLALSFLVSKHPKKVNYRPVLMGLLVQILLGLLCIRWTVGRSIFACLGAKVDSFLQNAAIGAQFVYGDALINRYAVFAFSVLSVIYFFSFCISILYYLGAMQWILLKLGWILQCVLGTTVCESIMAAANIFLGISEAPLLIRPYLKDLTHSELHSIMASGFATVSGTVLAAYISFGASPGHLITASVISAPAVLCVGKIVYPEVEESKTSSDNIQMEKSTDSSLVDAACNGATTGISLVHGIIANLIAFVSFIAFVNGILGWLGMLVGVDAVSLEGIFGLIFRPLAFLMGVSWEDSGYVGEIIGTKTVINEFVAYERLGALIRNQTISPRSVTIATYAICGFANPCSLGISIGVLSALVPDRRTAITSVSMRAMFTGSVACFMTACIAGLLISESPTEEPARLFNVTV